MKKEHSFGVIPFRKIKEDFEVLLVKHGAGHWAFPKGHSEKGESPKETAQRELFEETGLKIHKFFPMEPLEENYFFQKGRLLISKRVTYFLAFVVGECKICETEISDFKWLSLEKAENLSTFKQTKALIGEIKQRLEGDPNRL